MLQLQGKTIKDGFVLVWQILLNREKGELRHDSECVVPPEFVITPSCSESSLRWQTEYKALNRSSAVRGATENSRMPRDR